MRVLIVGAGIAGLAAARGLLDQGHEVTVLERAPALRDGGCAIVLWNNGTAILDDLGVKLDGLGQRIDAIDVSSAQGLALMSVDTAQLADRFGSPVLGVTRNSLHTRLAEDIPEGIVHFVAGVSGLHDDGHSVRVETEDGRSYTGDLLIGADGVNSQVRAALFGSASRLQARPTGAATWQGLIPAPFDIGSRSRLYMGRLGGVGLNPAGEGQLQYLIDLRHRPGLDVERPDRALGILRERYADWAEPVTALLAALTEEDLEHFPHRRHRVGRRWGRGRTLLIGDAAHAMPPILAQGAGQALEDVSALLRHLPEADIDTAAGREELQRTFTSRRRKQARLASMVATKSLATAGPRTLGQSEAALRGSTRMPDGLPTRIFEKLIGGVSDRL